MSPTKARYLLDANVLIALLTEDHIHYELTTRWFNADPNMQWAVCTYTENAFLRYATAQRFHRVTIEEATTTLARFTEHPGHHYLPITANWRELCGFFLKRIFGYKQITDAYLLGLAVRENYVLVTMDKAILHLAGEFRDRVLLLGQGS